MIFVNFYGRMSQLFGYVSANPKMMNDEEQQRYRGAYCGLCRALGKRHGQLTRFSLTYDMTFLALFLGAMYEPEEQHEKFWCIVHPKKKHESVNSIYTEYAADMNVLMAYLNCMDDWQDDKNPVALLESLVFRKAYLNVQKKYPRQAEAIRREMQELACLEKQKCNDPDRTANCFGRLLGEIFVVDESDHFAGDLRNFGFYLGKFIYLYDAIMDLEKDFEKGNYNPFSEMYGSSMDEETARNLLTFYISACVENFERLPIIQDREIIKNILYSGVWQAFKRKFEDNRSGSKES